MDDCPLRPCIQYRHTSTQTDQHQVSYIYIYTVTSTADGGTQLPDTVETINISRKIVRQVGLIYSNVQGCTVSRMEILGNIWSLISSSSAQATPYSTLQHFSPKPQLTARYSTSAPSHNLQYATALQLQAISYSTLQHFSPKP